MTPAELPTVVTLSFMEEPPARIITYVIYQAKGLAALAGEAGGTMRVCIFLGLVPWMP